MALSDDFARCLASGYIPAGLALTVAGTQADADILQRAVTEHSMRVDITSTLVTTLNALFGVTRTAGTWKNTFRTHRFRPSEI